MSNYTDASLIMFPSGYKEDKIYSLKPTDGSGDLTFTRASTATRVNSDGLIETSPVNLIDESERFANWNLQGTSVSNDTTTAPNGTTTADTIIELNTTDEHNRYLEPSIGGGVFTYSIYLKRFNTDWASLYVFNTAVGGVRHWVNLSTLTAGTSANIGSGIGTTSLSLESVGNGWVRASISFTNPSGSCRFYVANAQSNGGATSYAGNGTNGLYAWGAQVNIGATAKPYFPTTDRLNVPRIDYTGGGCGKLLLEPQRTNLVTYSEQFDNAGWTKNANVSITANNTTSPDGTQNADKMTNSGASSIQVYQLFSTSTALYTHTIYAKKGTNKYLGMSLTSNATASDRYVVYFDLDNGLIHQVYNTSTPLTNTSNSIQSVGNGWYRCVISADCNGQVYAVYQCTNNGTLSLAINGDLTNATNGDTYIWGAQAEAGSYVSSYVPTLASSVTRLADAASKTGISSLIGQTEGTLYAEVNVSKLIGTASRYIFHISDGTANNRIYMAFSGSSSNVIRGRIFNGGTLQCTIDSSTIATTGTYKLALAYKLNDIALYINGVQIGVDTSATIPTCSRVDIGQNYANASQFSDRVQSALLFPTRLSNATLATLTTL